MLQSDLHPRWITFALAAVLVAVAALTGLGVYVTTTQIRALDNVVYETTLSEVRRQVVPQILAHLERREERTLATLEQAASLPVEERAERLASIGEGAAEIDLPVIFARSGDILYPQVHLAPAPGPLAHHERQPDDYRRAIELLWRDEPEQQIVQGLRAIHAKHSLQPRWRLRALAALGSYYLRTEDFSRAASTYDTLFEEFATRIEDLVEPSYLHLILARMRALAAGGRRAQAASILHDVIDGLIGGDALRFGLDEEEHFARAVREFVDTPGDLATGGAAERPSTITGLRPQLERLESRLRHFRLARSANGRIGPAVTEVSAWHRRVEPHRIRLELGGFPRLFSFRAARLGEARVAAVGFLTRREALTQLIDEACDAVAARGGNLAALHCQALAADDSAEGRPATGLPAPLESFRVAVAPDAWLEHRRERQRPLQIARIFIPTLGLFMAVALLTFYRSYVRLRHVSRMKTDFVANVSHELKTPLALIRMFGETLLLRRVPDAEKQDEYYRIITRESERLSLLINNVLDFASIESGHKDYDMQSVDLARVTADTLRSYQFQLDEKGFLVDLELPEEPTVTQADPHAIAQAIINLINNAVKYSVDDREIRVRVWNRDDGIAIQVKDRGIGIPEEDQRRIFEGFYRSRAHSQLGKRGTGLGLALLSHIVESHDGHVELQSRPGEGSAFTLVFPRREEPRENSKETGSSHARSETQNTRGRG